MKIEYSKNNPREEFSPRGFSCWSFYDFNQLSEAKQRTAHSGAWNRDVIKKSLISKWKIYVV